MNYRLEIQYDGTKYRGWQRQSGTDRTIQGKIENVLSKMTGQEICIDGAGRTDAGVHAAAQTANVHIPENKAPGEEKLKAYLNEYLPEDIRILHVRRAGERFHSRLNAVGKMYRYHMIKYDRDDVFLRNYAWKVKEPLDIEAMRRAAAYLIGKKDFRSFCAKPSKKKSTVRTLESIQIDETDTEITLTFKGDGFLHHMVRILTGTLVEVGAGKRSPEEMPSILEKKERRYAGETAPAKGLFLVKVYYD
ncbi:MAG: tRNA pseudouridine(38-40) synthase TruA [Roseburia sp.]|nr:tRNA pseudouridine(38-40) synthase TruA [Roseburia sp.]